MTRPRAARAGRWLLIWAAVTVIDLVLVAGACSFYAFVWEPNRVILERVTVSVHGRTGRAGTVRVAQISDLDLTRAPGMRERRARALLSRAGADFVAFSGDIIGNVPESRRAPLLRSGIDYLASLPSAHGTFIVLGEEDRGHRGTIESLLPPNVHLVEDGARSLTVRGLDVLVCGPGGHFPGFSAGEHYVGHALRLGSGVSRRALLYKGPGSEGWRDYELSGRLRLGRRGDSFGIVLYASASKEGGGGYEFVKNQGENGFHLAAGEGSEAGGRRGWTAEPQPERWYRFRIRAETNPRKTRVRSRFWAEGETEPGDWQGDIADAGKGRSTGGTIGFINGGWGSGREKYVTDIAVTPLAGGPPLLVERFDEPARVDALWPAPHLDFRKRDLVVMIVHSPEFVRGFAHTEELDLMLAGHTQGGQAVLPLFGPVRSSLVFDPNLYSGIYHFGPMTLNINRGIGMAVFPARINCPPEVTLLDCRIGSS